MSLLVRPTGMPSSMMVVTLLLAREILKYHGHDVVYYKAHEKFRYWDVCLSYTLLIPA